MIKIKNFVGDNDNIKIIEEKGIFKIIEHQKDLSVTPTEAPVKYYMQEMGCKEKQLMVMLKDNAVRLKPGAMQFMLGNITSNTGVKGAGDLLGKTLKGMATGDSAIKPLYKGSGVLMCEPTYSHLLIENLSEWNNAMVCDDGSFVCCDDEIQDTVVRRTNLSSAVAGGEGLFNLCLRGQGHAVIQSRVPREELYEVCLENDCIKIDGNNAICWSASLEFTVERSGKSLIGSAASGEGLVNVYRGTGKILMMPLKPAFGINMGI
jgi:uncharacterized protein (AIM24 family)